MASALILQNNSPFAENMRLGRVWFDQVIVAVCQTHYFAMCTQLHDFLAAIHSAEDVLQNSCANSDHALSPACFYKFDCRPHENYLRLVLLVCSRRSSCPCPRSCAASAGITKDHRRCSQRWYRWRCFQEVYQRFQRQFKGSISCTKPQNKQVKTCASWTSWTNCGNYSGRHRPD